MPLRHIAIDTVVLSCALGVRRIEMSSEWHEQGLACRQLFERNPDLALPAPVLTEALRFAPPDEQQAIYKLVQRIRILAINARSAVMTANLLNRMDQGREVCSKCREFSGKRPCPSCGRIRGANNKILDAMIAACLLSQDGSWTLYTYNVDDFSGLLDGQDRIVVQTPPVYESPAPLLEYLDSLPQQEDERESGSSHDHT